MSAQLYPSQSYPSEPKPSSNYADLEAETCPCASEWEARRQSGRAPRALASLAEAEPPPERAPEPWLPSATRRVSYGKVYDCNAAIKAGFLRKVYGILSAQLLLTIAGASTFMFVDSARSFALSSPGVFYTAIFMPLGLLFALMCYKDKHPVNLCATPAAAPPRLGGAARVRRALRASSAGTC